MNEFDCSACGKEIQAKVYTVKNKNYCYKCSKAIGSVSRIQKDIETFTPGTKVAWVRPGHLSVVGIVKEQKEETVFIEVNGILKRTVTGCLKRH